MFMADYWTPLNTVTDAEFDEYLATLESTLEERLESIPDYEVPVTHDAMGLTYPSQRDDHHSVERTVYRNLLDALDHVEDNTDLMMYAQDEIEGSSDLSGPFGTFLDLLDAPIRNRKRLVLQDIFDQAKKELD